MDTMNLHVNISPRSTDQEIAREIAKVMEFLTAAQEAGLMDRALILMPTGGGRRVLEVADLFSTAQPIRGLSSMQREVLLGAACALDGSRLSDRLRILARLPSITNSNTEELAPIDTLTPSQRRWIVQAAELLQHSDKEMAISLYILADWTQTACKLAEAFQRSLVTGTS